MRSLLYLFNTARYLSVHCASPSLSQQLRQAMRRRVCYVKYLERWRRHLWNYFLLFLLF